MLAGDNDVVFRGVADPTKYTKYFGEDSIDQYLIIEEGLLSVLLSWRNLDGSTSKARLEWMDERRLLSKSRLRTREITNGRSTYTVRTHNRTHGCRFTSVLPGSLLIRGTAHAMSFASDDF